MNFDRAAEIYDSTRGFPEGVGAPVVAALVQLAKLSSADRIVEIGIGTGRIAKPLAAALGADHQLTGIDISRQMMRRLVETMPAKIPCPLLVEANATQLPFAPRSFDAAVLVHVIHLISNWRDLLKELQRAVKAGGLLIGGWNDHDDRSSGMLISQKFRDVARAHGISTARQGLENFADVVAHVPAARVTSATAAKWVAHRAPRLALQSLADRHFSSSWLVPDDVFPIIMKEVEAWCAAQWHDLDQPIPETRRFKWLVLQLPA